MTEEIDFETYLYISPRKFGIYIYNIKKFDCLFKEEYKFENLSQNLKTDYLSLFLEKNIFKIEKLIGNFVNNIYVLIDNYKITNLSFGIKKKNYQENIKQDFLEEILTESKDLFKENYQNQKILHVIINRYIVDHKSYMKFNENFKGNHFCIEVEFKYISKEFINEIDKVLSGFQIKIFKVFDGNYVKDFFKKDKIELPKIFSKIHSGFNENEVEIIVKNHKKSGFFEKFFQLFS